MNKLVENKVYEAVQRTDYDGLVVADVGNFVYLTGCVPPLGLSRPARRAVMVQTRKGSGTIVCPSAWAEAFRDQGWDGPIRIYGEGDPTRHDGFLRAVSIALKSEGLSNGKLGVDVYSVSRYFIKRLSASNAGVDWQPCDRLLTELRIIKTKDEVEFLEKAANQAEKGIIGALHHLEGAVGGVGYSLAEFLERVRVHVIEFGGSGVGYLAASQGTDAAVHYVPSRGMFRLGNMVRIDFSNHHLGYWSSAGRMLTIGPPSSSQNDAYDDNLKVKNAARCRLEPGIRSDRLFQQVEEVARNDGIRFWPEVGIGHGVGTSDWEPPYLRTSDKTVLESGMVIALDVYTYGPCGELVHSKDTYEITEEGCRLLSWYKRWDELYAVTGTRARH
jgi:Xaa-Pro dipeptidase